MNVLVTGVAGFIGSHLAEKLIEEKFEVIGIDCFTDYYSKKIKKNNLQMLQKNENFEFLEQDIMEIDLIPFFKKSKFLFHQAAQPGVRASWGNEFQTYVKDNILATQKILESAKETNTLKKIIMASSSSIYGEQEGIMTEQKTIPKPVSPYGATKLASENLGMIYASNYNLPITSLRYFTVYGPRQRPDMGFFRFIKSNLKKDEISIFGTGKQIRDFTFISDIIDANVNTMKSDIHGNVLNIGGNKTYSILEVLSIIEKITKIKNKLNFISEQKGDVRKTEADISKANKIIEYNPKINLVEGITKQIEWMKNVILKN